MSKMTINGDLGAEGFNFIEKILHGLEGRNWLKRAIRECLRHDPEQALDDCTLLLKCMEMRIAEEGGVPVGDEN